MTLDTARSMIEEKQNEGMNLAAAVQFAVGMKYCTTVEAAQLRQEYESRGNATAPAVPTLPIADHTVPVLKIDWGMDLKPGTHLTPEFTILGLDAQIKPLVSFPLDRRIQCEDWNPTPKLSHNNRGWQFYQPLRLNEPGQYLLHVTLIDPTPGQAEPRCYRCDFRVTVPESEAGQLDKSLKITADDMTADLSNVLKNFHHVELDLKGAVINAHESSLTDKISTLLQSGKQQVNQQKDMQHVMSLPFIPDGEIAVNIPYISTRKPATPLTRATLYISHRPAIHLICGKTLTFGRNVPQEKPNDVSLAVEPTLGYHVSETERAGFARLNMSFSREHALLEVTDQNVMLCDCRKPDGDGMADGTVVDGKPLAKQECVTMFSCNETAIIPRTILFSKMLAMRVAPYCETVEPDSFRELTGELLMQLYDVKLPQSRHISVVQVAPDKTVTERLQSWLDDKKFCKAQHDMTETVLVVTSATVGGARDHVISVPGPVWREVYVRILNLDSMLYLENIDTPRLVAVCNDSETTLKPLRPIPIQPGLVIRRDGRDLFHFR